MKHQLSLKRFSGLTILFLGLLTSLTTHAYTISASPSPILVNVNDTFSIDINISGLDQTIDEIVYVNTFNSFNNDIINFSSMTPNYSALGPLTSTGSTNLSNLLIDNNSNLPGSIYNDTVIVQLFDQDAGNAFVTDPSSSSQPNAFTIYTLNFTAIAVGSTYLDLSDQGLSAVNSPLTNSLSNLTNITVNPTAVPLPAGIWLLLSGIIGIGWFKFKNMVFNGRR